MMAVHHRNLDVLPQELSTHCITCAQSHAQEEQTQEGTNSIRKDMRAHAPLQSRKTSQSLVGARANLVWSFVFSYVSTTMIKFK